MVSFITKNLNQTAVHWANRVEVGDADATFDNGVEVDVRWEERQELFVDSFGNERRSQAIVFVAIDIKVGEYLFLGDLDDSSLDSNLENFADVDSFEVKAFKKVSTLAGDQFERKCFL